MMNIRNRNDRVIFLTGVYPLMLLVIFILPFFSVEDYSIIKNTTSQLGAQHTPNAWIMNLTFVLLGTATILDAWRFLWKYWLHSIVISIFGVALMLTAFYSHAPILDTIAFDVREDELHSLFAQITGFSFTFFAISAAFIESTTRRKILAFSVGFMATSLSIIMFTYTDYMGICQRLIFIINFAWLIFFFKRRQK